MAFRLDRAVLLGSLLLGCGDPMGPDLSSGDELTLQIVPNLNWHALAADQVVISAAELDGLTLHLTLRFGGGCKVHRFALVAGDSWGESYPPYTVLRLAHDGAADPCDALLSKQVRIDLSPLVPLIQRAGAAALRFELLEPGERRSAVGELLLIL